MTTYENSLTTIARGALLAVGLAALVAPGASRAAVARLDVGSQVGATQTTATSLSGTDTVSAGTNRLLVVTVYVRKSASDATFSVTTATYGGQALTQVQATTATSRDKVYIGYLKEAGIVAAGANNTINITISAGTTTEWSVFSQTYSGVDQTTPITASTNSYNETNTTTTANFTDGGGTALSVNAGGFSYYALAFNSASGTRTLPASYVQNWTLATTNITAFGDDKAVATAGSESPTITYSPGQRYALAAITLNPAASNTLTIGNGTEPSNSTINASQTAALDAFTLQTSSGTATVTAVAVNMASVTNVASISINSASNCGGTSYGTLSSGLVVGNNTINTSGLSATTTVSNAWVCVTSAASVSGTSTITGNVSSVTASGYSFTDNDTASATVTIQAPATTITIGNGTEPSNSTIGASQTAALDAFTLQTSSGTATVTAVAVNLAAITNVASISINSAANCGGTSYGTLSSGLVVGNNTINTSGLSATTTVSNAWVCVTSAASVSATSTITGTVSSVTASGYSFTDNDTASATVTIQAPAVNTVSPGAPSIQSATTTQVVVAAPFTDDSNGNSSTSFSRATGTCPQGSYSAVANCSGVNAVTGASPRTCTDTTGITGGTTYCYQVSFADTDGITSGYPNPQTVQATTPGAAGTLAVTAGTMPTGTAAQGSSGTIVGRIVLTTSPAGATVTLNSLSISNTGTAVNATDVASLSLFNDAAPNAFVASGVWNATTSHWDFNGIGLDVAAASPVTLRVVLGVNIGATVGRTFIMNMNVPADVTVVAPGTVSNSVTIAGGSFNIVAAPAGSIAGSTNVNAPMVSIINPKKGGVVSPNSQYKVQVRVFNKAGIAGITANSVQLSYDGTTWPTCPSTTDKRCLMSNPPNPPNTAYDSGSPVTGRIYETTLTTADTGVGSYTLRARASNASVSNVLSEPVQISVAPAGTGDGNLLVRDNSAQICNDCHALQTHSSEGVGTKYGSWAVTCRDCHSPHGTRNIFLVQETITPPSVGGTVQTARRVGFTKLTGDSNAAGWSGSAPTSSGSFVNSDMTGPCQVCHTRTASPPPASTPRWRNTGNSDTTHYAVAGGGTQSCATCHSHTGGFAASCTGCHGTPGRSTPASEAPPLDSCGNATSGNPGIGPGLNRVGAHQKHLVGGTLTASGVTCNQCHRDPPNRPGHPDPTLCTTSTTANRAQFTWGPLANGTLYGWSSTVTPTYNYSTQACNNYCHGNFTNGNTTNAPTWNSTAACGTCHGTPPAGTHPTVTAGTRCNSCHPAGYTFTAPSTCTGICVDQAKHINGKMDADCTGCHANPQGPRRAVVGEFTNSTGWSHKRSSGFTVTPFDCTVCHMEGNPANGDRDPTYHQNGVINLRDPDTGANIKGVTFTAASGASPGFYTATAVNATFTSFSRNLSVTLESDPQFLTLAAIMVNQCLKCHDNNGAAAYGAGLPLNPLVAQIGGSAAKPFGTTIAGTGYSNGTLYPGTTLAGVTANAVAGGVTDINESFKTTNSSYHPISGKQNNSYAAGTRMAVPWNMTKTAGSTANWGYLLSCWDCHALPADTGTITKTVTAHGGTATVRGTPTPPNTAAAASATNEATLCKKCHAGYDTCTSQNHCAGSAAVPSGQSPMSTYMRYGCNMCHASGYGSFVTGTTAVIRPIRAMDVHGVNALMPTTASKTVRWAGTATGTPATVNARPYAFIRNTAVLSDSTPHQIGGTTYTANCNMRTNPCSQGSRSYTPGGTY